MTSTFFRRLSQLYVLSRVYSLITRFGLNPEGILKLLKDNRSIISGSAALHALFTGANIAPFDPKDIDFYIPHYRRDAVVEYFIEETEFDIIASYPRLAGAPYDSQYMTEVIIMKSQDAIINIIISSTKNPMDPLFSFHSTCVMNAITAYGIWSAYPSLTLDFQNLINPLRSGNNTACSILRLKGCMEKYRQRGFKDALTLSAWKEHKLHECSTYPSCPHTERNTRDEGTLFFPFDSLKVIKNRSRRGRRFRTICWTLGGYMCDDSSGLSAVRTIGYSLLKPASYKVLHRI